MLLVFLKFVLLITLVKATCVDNDLGVPDFTNSADARPNGGPLVTWTVYGGTQTVVFEVTAITGRWIGVGLSDGRMFLPDLIIGGVNNGVPYFADRFAAGYGEPPEDTEQNWFLIEGNDVGGDTILKFCREFDTGDAQADFKIEDRDINLIWARGSAHAITYHNARGIIPVNILRAPVTEPPPTTTTPAPPSGSPDFTNSLILRDGLTVDWGVYYTDEMVLFEVTSNTIGWIGFGISPTGNMNGADLVMAGFDVAGATCYFSDRFVTSPGTPIVDTSEDWFLIDCTEENGQTKLQFYRKFETGDTTQDFVIKDEETKFIWALGPTDELGYHGFADRGNASVNILRDASATTGTTDTTVTPPTPAPPSGSPDFTNSISFRPGLTLDWGVYLNDQMVSFEIMSKTIGWLGFGIAPSGSMYEADLIMGGYNSVENRPYFGDYYSTSTEPPIMDDNQDWYFSDCVEENGETRLKFYRKFDTQDDTGKDFVIKDEETKFIWAVGPDDALVYHEPSQSGNFTVNILKELPVTTETTIAPPTPAPPGGSPDFTNSLSLGPGLSVEWSVHLEEKLVVFEVTSDTTGWVGFGLNPKGNMNGADLVMGGYNLDENRSYFSDRFSSAMGTPPVDESQDWFLMEATEAGGQTVVKFYRKFDTGDTTQDYPITDEDTKFIWAVGPSDDLIGYHGTSRGSVDVNILKDPAAPTESTASTKPVTTPEPPVDLPDFTNSLLLREGLTVNWSVFFKSEQVVFEVTSDTIGWIGFGIAPTGNMFGADMVMGGYDGNGASYFSDLYTIEAGTPPVDNSQDWYLMDGGGEVGGKTTIKFYRKFNTGDVKDFVIKDERTRFIWALGPSDNIAAKHEADQGRVSVNILQDPATGSTETPTSPAPPSGEPDFSHSLNLRDGFTVEWSVYNELQLVSFEVTSNTVGWVGFGISKAGSMSSADVVMGGWNAAGGGEVYFDDRFASAQGMPVVDFRQNWYLIDCSEDGGQTKLKFYREFNTGDSEEDFEIKDEETNFIWATGPDDTLTTAHAVVDMGRWPVNILSKEEPAGPPAPATKKKTPLAAIWVGLGLMILVVLVDFRRMRELWQRWSG